MRSIRSLLLDLFGPTSKFTVGEGVQLADGHDLMVVIEIVNGTGTKGPLYHCQWYDAEAKVSRKHFFTEKELTVFDWYHHSVPHRSQADSIT